MSPGKTMLALLAVGTAVGCGGVDNRPPTWPFIYSAIIEPSCATANCHSAIAARASVDLSTRDIAYFNLTARNFVIPDDGRTQDAGFPAGAAGAAERVDRSTLMQLLRAQGNLRMPPDQPLPSADIDLIQTWIHNGAAQ
jgi:hypothetical protein